MSLGYSQEEVRKAKEEYRARLLESDDWVERALVAIRENNGFAPWDVLLTDFADDLQSGRRQQLTPRQLEVARKTLVREYAGRLVDITRRKQVAVEKAELWILDPAKRTRAKAVELIVASGLQLQEYTGSREFAEAVLRSFGAQFQSVPEQAYEKVVDLVHEAAAVMFSTLPAPVETGPRLQSREAAA
jgi:hypothetical protein